MADAGRVRHPAWVVSGAAVVAACLVVHASLSRLPPLLWWQFLQRPDLDDVRQLLLLYSFLPRLATLLLCGAALALAGTIFQQVLRTPLAEPTTIGVSAGASLALTLALAFAPGLLVYSREWVTLAGAAVAMLAVFGLASRRTFSPLVLILSGLLVSLYCGALSAGVRLFENPSMLSFDLWSAGSLTQQDWSVVLYLLPRLAVALVAASFLARPLAMLDLDDESARSLGVPLISVRLVALIVAVSLSAFVVSAVGVIGFIGLAGPALVRLSGARRFGAQLLWAPLLGAVLLCLTDQLVQWGFGSDRELMPTGAATALLGVPLLLWLLARSREIGEPPAMNGKALDRRARHPWRLITIGLCVVVVFTLVSLHLGQDGHGWEWSSRHDLTPLLRWRAPRLLGALAAGVMLALAGTLLQRMTGNPMASPEILGITSGAAIGLVVLLAFATGFSRYTQIGASTLGSLAVLMLTLLIGRRSAYAPTRTLLAGIAVAALCSSLLTVFMASGDPRVLVLRNWMAGTTNLITWEQASTACIVGVALFVACALTRRWLEILPLGPERSAALGLNMVRTRLLILLLTAILTATATLTIGPLGFVGLLGPHLARMLGLQRPLSHLAGAATLGGVIMIAADWLSRMVLFPYEVPAGLLATLIGGPYLMMLISRRSV